MKRYNIIILIIGLVLLVGIFSLYYLNKKPSYDWRETYQQNSSEPYGLSFFNDVIKNSVPEDSFVDVKQNLSYSLDSNATGTYIAINDDLYYHEYELDTLLNFVKRGNQAFLCSKRVPYELQELLFQQNEDSLFYPLSVDHKEIKLHLTSSNASPDTSFTVFYQVKDTIDLNTWYPYDPSLFIDSLKYTELGYFTPGENINFLEVKYGKGAFYFHSSPLSFTNLHFAKEKGLAYANNVLSHLKTDKIYLDKKAYYSFSDDDLSFNSNVSDGPLTYLLSIKSMRWAWYLILFLIVLYLLFNLKRIQRIIPLADKNENSSLAFVQSIGSLYFNTGNHKKIAIKEMELFLFHIRKKYNLNTSNLNDEFIDLLALKTEVNPNLIKSIIEKYKAIDYLPEVSDQMLISFHQLLEEFYNTRK